jgi:hypothetical protein
MLKIVAGPIDHDTSVNTGTAPAPSATGEDKPSSYKLRRAEFHMEVDIEVEGRLSNKIHLKSI